MTVASDRITLLFSILGGAEVATISFATAPTVTPTQAEMEDLALTASSLWVSEAWGTLKAYYQNTTTFLGAQARSYDGSNGLVASGESILTTPVAGSSSSASLPPGTATVVSLRTAIPGARGRGRLYMPATVAGTILVSGRMDATYAAAVADDFQDFFDGWNADPSTFPVGVASQAGGFVSTVNSIRVGNVFDSQRRRRDALAEAYISRTIT